MQRDWKYGLAVAALTILAVVRVASTHRTFSATVDEPIHLASGYEWFKGELTPDMTHPPLARVLGALPLRLEGLPYPQPTNMVERGNQLLYAGDHYVKNLARARMGNLVLLIVAILTVAGVGEAGILPGSGSGISGPLLFAAPPARTRRADHDRPLRRGHAAPRAPRPRALSRGADLEARHVSGARGWTGSAFEVHLHRLLPPSVLAMLLVRRPLRARWATALGALLLAFVMVWAGYRFDVRRPADVVDEGANLMEWAAPGPLKPLARFLAHVPIPAPAMALGMAQVKLHELLGHTAYLLGPRAARLVVLLPRRLLLQIAPALAAARGLGRRRSPAARDRQGLQFLLIPLAILLTAMTTSLNIGARHILPTLAPLSIVAGYAVISIWRTSRDAFGRTALAGLLVWLFAGVAVDHPDYLAWFNELAQPNPSWFAADSNIDWGQDVLRLSKAVEELKIEHLHTAFMNSTRLGAHGIEATGLVPHQKVSGWVAVSENWLRFGEATGDYDWLRTYRPVRQIGKTIRLYNIP